jgi:hypothetical protein
MTAQNIAGQKFGKLTFIRATDQREGGRHIMWEAVCDCGTTIITSPRHAKQGRVKSCGCYNREINRIKGESNRKFDPAMSSARMIWKRRYHDCDFDTFLNLSQQPCYYCGARPYRTVNIGIRKNYNASVYQLQDGYFTYNGLDRVDSTKGHTVDNVVPCCSICNRMKSNLTIEEFRAHIEQLHTHWSGSSSAPNASSILRTSE